MLPAMESSSKRQNSISVNENVNKTDISRDLKFLLIISYDHDVTQKDFKVFLIFS